MYLVFFYSKCNHLKKHKKKYTVHTFNFSFTEISINIFVIDQLETLDNIIYFYHRKKNKKYVDI